MQKKGQLLCNSQYRPTSPAILLENRTSMFAWRSVGLGAILSCI